MIRFNLIWIIVLLSQSLAAQQKPRNIKFNKLTEVDNVLYLKNSPINGYYKIKYNRWESEVSNFSNGKREGLSKWLRLRKLESEGQYENNSKKGLWKRYLYSSGALLTTTNYLHGKKDGKEIHYSDGSEKKIFNYINDALHGWQREFGYQGKLKSKSFYESGDLRNSQDYFFDGSLEKECFLKNGTGHCIKYRHENSGIENLKIRDSIFLQAGKQTALKSYVKDSIDFGINIQIEVDTIRQFSDKTLTISFYKRNRFIQSYIFYISSYCWDDDFVFDRLASWVIDSYKSYFYSSDSENVYNSYSELCEMMRWFWLDKRCLEKVYLKTDQDLFEYSLIEKGHDCRKKLVKTF